MKNTLFDYKHLNEKGFSFSHPFISFTYTPNKNHNLVVDLYGLHPTRFTGGVNVNSAFSHASVASMYSLDTILPQRITLDGVKGNKDLFGLLKKMDTSCTEEFSAKRFAFSNVLLKELLHESQFYSAYHMWHREEVFPTLDAKEKQRYNEVKL